MRPPDTPAGHPRSGERQPEHVMRSRMPESANDKATARSRFVNDRLTLGNHLLRKASSELTQRLLQAPELRVSVPDDVVTVCAYASFGTEPDTTELVDSLHAQGVRVLLPVL